MKKKFISYIFASKYLGSKCLEALEVEKFKENSNVVAYELGHFINKKIVSVFKNKLHKKYIQKVKSYSEWKAHFLRTIKKYDEKNFNYKQKLGLLTFGVSLFY